MRFDPQSGAAEGTMISRAPHPRDPWFPIALMLLVVFSAWLGVFGPLPHGFWAELQKWQTLVGAMVALSAAGIALWNTTRSLRQAQTLEQNRRDRKHAAVRAVLPLALAEISGYAEKSAYLLNEAIGYCDKEHETLPSGTALAGAIQA